ncbi:MAG: PhnD/SsuA/transferrin family substrate-binding protein [bacterium]|nr:PhnD/SsuA/transferrin family substrate-binding protein [bacterium]
MRGDHDPFADAAADIGFVCSPALLYLRSLPRPTVQLIGAAPVFQDERHDGESPVYYSDVVVRSDDSAQSFEELENRVWGYNDTCSLSGYFAALQQLRNTGCTSNYFRERRCTGSHVQSLRALLTGEIDAAAIDSTTLTLSRKEDPAITERLRVIASWGPFPVQPMVARADLDATLHQRITAAMLRLDCSGASAIGLCSFGLERFVPITAGAYSAEERELRALGQLHD